MKIGYPCINTSIDCTSNSTFRLKSYSKENLIHKIKNNLNCLKKILKFNIENNLLFFRIGSSLIPFASHPVNKFDWENYFKEEFKDIGFFIKKNKIRISMHPSQFVVLNSLDKNIIKNSIKEVDYHCKILDSMNLNSTHKVQIHVGGVYGNKKEATQRFIKTYKNLDSKIKKRLVIENDEKSFSLKDCLKINKEINIPIILDTLHHECYNNKENFKEAIKKASRTWKKKDGIPMIDYSNQAKNEKKGKHSKSINTIKFKNFLKETKTFDFDIMLEIKDKEKSALKAIKLIK